MKSSHSATIQFALKWRDHIRREYYDFIEAQYLAAEEYTRGHLVRAEYREWISPRGLFEGPEGIAMKYASDELKQFWRDEVERVTFAEFERRAVDNFMGSYAWLLPVLGIK